MGGVQSALTLISGNVQKTRPLEDLGLTNAWVIIRLHVSAASPMNQEGTLE